MVQVPSATAALAAFTPEHLPGEGDAVGIGEAVLIPGFPLGFHDGLHHFPVVRQGAVVLDCPIEETSLDGLAQAMVAVAGRRWGVQEIAAELADVLEQRAFMPHDVVPEFARGEFFAQDHGAAESDQQQRHHKVRCRPESIRETQPQEYDRAYHHADARGMPQRPGHAEPAGVEQPARRATAKRARRVGRRAVGLALKAVTSGFGSSP